MSRRNYPHPTLETLASLEVQHTAALAGDKPASAGKIRFHARDVSNALGIAPPAWCARHAAKPKPLREPREPRAAKPAAKPRAAAPREPRAAKPAKAPPSPASPLEIPAALRAWREQAPGRVVNIQRGGAVRLLQFGDFSARLEVGFASIAVAVAAIAAGLVWRSAAPSKLGSWRHTKAVA